MPELPEMETYRRLLLPLIVYRPIASVEIQRERSINIPVEQFRAKRTLLKPALVEQSFIAGIGNCYADEICHEAGILPERPCADLQRDESARLLAAMRSVLAEAMQYGGYMEHPLTKEDQWTGGYDERCRVYDREGEPCPRCGQPINLATLRSRKTYYCRNCQR